MASHLADLQLRHDTQVVVELLDGEIVRGAVEEVRFAELRVLVRAPDDHRNHRTIAEGDIQTIGVVVGMSKQKRRWLGAAVGAAASLPFSISTFGDMVVPGAIAGALFGGGRGDLREEVIFERVDDERLRTRR